MATIEGPMNSLQNIHEQLASRPLRPLQMLVITLGVLINMVDGFDLLAASLVSPILKREWQLEPEMLGLLLSAGPLGTATGALLLSPVADLYGRRSAILANLLLMSLGMMLSALADSVTQLTVLRFLTGMGVGAMASCVGTLVFEYCSLKTRNLGLGLVTIGYNVGVVIGGILASQWLIGAYGWRSVFVFGGVTSALLVPLVYWLLPESIDFMVAKPRANTLGKLNRVLSRLELRPFETLPAPSPKVARSSPLDLLRQPILPRLLFMQLAYFLYMLSSYFFLNWNNQLTTDAGFADEQGRWITILTNAGGIAGGVLVGLITFRLPFRPVATVTLLAMGIGIMVFGASAGSLAFTVTSSMFVGFTIFGAAVVLYATGAATFPARVRATGMGLSMSAGRLGSFVGPLSAGLLLGADIGRFWTCLILAVPVMLSAVALARVPLTPLREET
jgi:benzoate transport